MKNYNINHRICTGNETCKMRSLKLSSFSYFKKENNWLETDCETLQLLLSNFVLCALRVVWILRASVSTRVIDIRKEKEGHFIHCQALILLRILSVSGNEQSLNNYHVQFPGIGWVVILYRRLIYKWHSGKMNF